MSVAKHLVCITAVASLSLGLCVPARAASLQEGFDNVGALSGWSLINNSSPLGSTDWFQGNSGVFPAFSGGAASYIAANFNNTANVGTISNWLITPTLSFNNGDTVSFYARTELGSVFPDRLEVRFSGVGGADVGSTATSVGTFGTLLGSINTGLDVGGYPDDWTGYSYTVSGLSGATSGSVAFRYFVTDGGPLGDNSNYIGIDSVAITPSAIAAVPEPSTWLMMMLGFGTLGSALRRRRREITPVGNDCAIA